MTRQFTVVLTSADGQTSSRFECEAETPQAALVNFAGLRPRAWLYGLAADEWMHLAAEGDDSEVIPCCANLSLVRELLNGLVTLQSPDDWGWRLSLGRRLLQATETDGDQHGLQDRKAHPLLHRVLDGVRAEQGEHHRERS